MSQRRAVYKMTEPERAFETRWRQLAPDVVEPDQEYVFHPTREWRFDFAWPKPMVAVEMQGGVWSGGAHTRGGGYSKDCEKMNEAVALGWRVFYLTPGMLADDPMRWVTMIAEAVAEVTV